MSGEGHGIALFSAAVESMRGSMTTSSSRSLVLGRFTLRYSQAQMVVLTEEAQRVYA